jgi:sulfur-oxidizing protein SoxZ
METGYRKDDAGRIVPAHYITDVQISLAGRTVLNATLSRAVSEDPLLYFRIRGGHADDKIVVVWTDTAGDRRVGEGAIVQA